MAVIAIAAIAAQLVTIAAYDAAFAAVDAALNNMNTEENENAESDQ